MSTDATEYDSGGATGFPTDLVFGKHDGKWQLLIELSLPDDTSDITPLLSCSRETRLRVFSEGHLEALVRGAVSQLDKQLIAREAAVEKARKLVTALGGGVA